MNFEETKQYLLKKECCTSEYDDKSFTVLEFGTFENVLKACNIPENDVSVTDRYKIAGKLQKKFKFASIDVTEDGYYIDFDFTLLKEDTNCNLSYILNAIHSFHDSFLNEVKLYVQNKRVVNV